MSEHNLAVWGPLARQCWLQMSVYPRNSPDWNLANHILHSMAAEQFPIYDFKPPQ